MRIIQTDGPDHPPVTVEYTVDGEPKTSHEWPVFYREDSFLEITGSSSFYIMVGSDVADETSALEYDFQDFDEEDVYCQALLLCGLQNMERRGNGD